MTDTRKVALTFPEAQSLAELAGLRADLVWAGRACDTLIRILSESPTNAELTEAFLVAILVKYARPFAKGTRRKIPSEWVHGLNADRRTRHDFILEFRNKHIAHSVNYLEANYVTTVIPTTPPEDFEIKEIEYLHQRLSSVGVEDVRGLQELARYFSQRIWDQCFRERSRVLELAQQLSHDELLALKEPRVDETLGKGVKNPSRSRRQVLE